MRPMRKAARQRDAAWAIDVLRHAPYATLSLTRPDGTPYGLPISLAVAPSGTARGERLGRESMHAML